VFQFETEDSSNTAKDDVKSLLYRVSVPTFKEYLRLLISQNIVLVNFAALFQLFFALEEFTTAHRTLFSNKNHDVHE
jgi:hypothetical protein